MADGVKSYGWGGWVGGVAWKAHILQYKNITTNEDLYNQIERKML